MSFFTLGLIFITNCLLALLYGAHQRVFPPKGRQVVVFRCPIGGSIDTRGILEVLGFPHSQN